MDMTTDRDGPRHGSRWKRSVAIVLALGALAVTAACGTTSSDTAGGRVYSATPEQINGYIAEASDRFDVPEVWIRSVMQVESGGRLYLNGRPTTSHAGAMGLMQVMPGTYGELRQRYDLGPDPYDPRDNIMAGTAYIREMYDRFGSPGFLAAYNAGPGRYGQYVNNGRPLPGETRRYIDLIYPQIAGILPDDHPVPAAVPRTTVYARNDPPPAAPRPVPPATPPRVVISTPPRPVPQQPIQLIRPRS